jgi:hypothetical protein
VDPGAARQHERAAGELRQTVDRIFARLAESADTDRAPSEVEVQE